MEQLFDDPFASSMSSLEADIFSGGGQLPSPSWPDLDLDDDFHELSAPAANAAMSSGYCSGGSGSHRKLSHNAYERDRRKQLNELYSSLRALLPDADHTKKLSIPTTVSRVLKYIPELQKQVENLERKKKELTMNNPSCKQGLLGSQMSESALSTAPIVSATCIDDMEIMVQISFLSNVAGSILPLSKCIKVLENEGLHLISSSTSSAFGNRTFYSLHLQRSEGTINQECPAFCERLEKVVRNKAQLRARLII
ncbi:protein IRON-RELATED TRANSCRIPTION FACTOR 2-like [Oryza brachyantha]|uniref:Protein IRON-RELATED TRANSCRIPTION FACTOR 2 n=1 Tax=Oryza brachyantha TaxID=4533 RepID=J3L7X4_ORYBR|nr:protein IRON-RELATED TRANSCRIPTION FACTOR 2-like [Oryza brachyantha]